VGFDVADQLIIILLCSSDVGEKWDFCEAAYKLFIDVEKALDSVRREAFYNIFVEFGVPMKLVRLITTFLN
jgi:hypothetical protein